MRRTGRRRPRSATPWLERTGAVIPGGPTALARFIAVLFDGLTLAWLADPEGAEPDEVFRARLAPPGRHHPDRYHGAIDRHRRLPVDLAECDDALRNMRF